MPAKNKNKKRLLVVLFIIAGILILSVNIFRGIVFRFVADFYYPFLNVPVQIEKSMRENTLLLQPKIKLVNMISTLRKENDTLRVKLLSLQSVNAENYELRFLSGLAKRSKYKCVFAEIITRDIVNWDKKFLINKGITDGIRPGNIVLTYYLAKNKVVPEWAVIGKICDVTMSKHTALVNTIFSKKCKISVKISNTKNYGVTYGEVYSHGQKFIKLRYLPRDSTYKPASKVVTSGLSHNTLGNLLVGWLSHKYADPTAADVRIIDNLYAEAKVIPVVNLENVQFVIIITQAKTEE